MSVQTAGKFPQNKGALRHYADGGKVSPYSIKGLFNAAKGLVTDTPEQAQRKADLAAYRAKAEAERNAKTQPAAPSAGTVTAGLDGAGGNSLANREKAAGMKIGGAIRGPGTGTSDDVPIMASNGEFVIKAAAVKKIGLATLEALNEIADDPSEEKDDQEPASHENSESKKVEAQEDRDEKAGRPERDGMACGGAVRKKFATGGLVTEEDKPKVDPMAAHQAQLSAAQNLATARASGTVSTPAQEVAGQTAYVAANQKANDATPFFNYFQQKGPGGSAVDTLRANADTARGAIYQGAPATPGTPAALQTAAAPSVPTPAATPSPTGEPRADFLARNPGVVANQTLSPGAKPAGAIAPTSTPVASGVTRIDAPGKSPLFTNLPAGSSDNASLQARAPITAQDQLALTALGNRHNADNQQAALGAIRKEQYDKEVAGAAAVNKAGGEMYLTPAQLDRRRRVENEATQIATGAATAKYGADTQAATARYGTDAQSKTAADHNAITRENFGAINKNASDRLGMDQQTHGFENRLKANVEKAQNALLSADTQEKKDAAIEQLRALQGKYGKEYPEMWKPISMQGGTDANGNKLEGVLGAVNTTTGEMKRYESAAKQAAPTKGAVVDGHKFKGGNPADQKNWEKV